MYSRACFMEFHTVSKWMEINGCLKCTKVTLKNLQNNSVVCKMYICDVNNCKFEHPKPLVCFSNSLDGSVWLHLINPKLWGLWWHQPGLPVWFNYSCKLKESFKGQRVSTSNPLNQSCPQLFKTFYRHASLRVGWGLQACCSHCAPSSQSVSERVPGPLYKCWHILANSTKTLLWTFWSHQLKC